MAPSVFLFLLLVSFLVVSNAQTSDGSQAFSLPGGILSLTSPNGTLPGTVFHTPTDSNSQSSTGTPTGTASQSGQTPQLYFNMPLNSLMTTCASAQLSWFYIGPQGISMSLTVTNNGVSQSSPAPTTRTNTYTNGDGGLVRKGVPGHLTTSSGSGSDDSEGNVSQTLTTSFDPDQHAFQWAPVNVPQGWYVAQATINGIITPSEAFFVQNGSDVSCLSTSPPTDTTTTTSSTPTNSPTSSGSPQTTPGSDFPVGGASSGSNLNKGAIAGGVIGGLAVLAAIITAIFFYRYSSAPSSRRPNGRFMGKWGNLGSFDSPSPAKVKQAKAKMYNGPGVGLAGLGIGTADAQRNLPPSSRHNSQAESIGPIIYHNARRTPGDSSEDVFSPYDEKYLRSPFSDPGHGDGSEELGMIPIGYESTSSPSVGMATTGHATRHSSMNSTYSYVQNNNFNRPRSQSTQYKASSSPQIFPESPSNPTIDTVSKRASSPTIPAQMSTSSLDHTPPSPAYPSGASATMNAPQSGRPTPSPIPMAGIAGVGASGSSPVTPTSRKTPRKPVPTYNPQDPTLMEPPTRIADVPTDVRNSDLPSSSSHDLNHKGSFGSFRQVHYLMPDMPPPQKD